MLVRPALGPAAALRLPPGPAAVRVQGPNSARASLAPTPRSGGGAPRGTPRSARPVRLRDRLARGATLLVAVLLASLLAASARLGARIIAESGAVRQARPRRLHEVTAAQQSTLSTGSMRSGGLREEAYAGVPLSSIEVRPGGSPAWTPGNWVTAGLQALPRSCADRPRRACGGSRCCARR